LLFNNGEMASVGEHFSTAERYECGSDTHMEPFFV